MTSDHSAAASLTPFSQSPDIAVFEPPQRQDPGQNPGHDPAGDLTGPAPRPALARAFTATLFVNFIAVLAILLAGIVTVSTAMAQETAAADTPQPLKARLVRPNDMGTGALLLPSDKPDFFVQAPTLETGVDIAINGPVARVKVTQRFENPSKEWAEGIYVFPLPEDSAVDTLKMKVGDRTIEGVIKKRDEARQIYEEAKQEGRKASLLEQQRDNIFTNSVANIGPGETVIVEIEYQQTVKQDNGTFSLRFPMVVAPRYSPKPVVQTVDFGKSGWGSTDPVPDRDKIEAPVLDPQTEGKINPLTLTVKLAAGFPLGEVESHFHKIVSKQQDDSTRILALENTEVPADRDFELTWTAAGTAPNAALFTERVGDHDYILAFVTPPRIEPDKLARKDRETIFVIDNSGSMAGESIVQAKLALEEALRQLTPADRFNIVRFDDTLDVLFPDAVAADRENLDKAVDFVRRLQANGGTEMLPALRAALVDGNPGDKRLRQVVFITDGAIGNEQQLFDAIATGKGRSRVFTIGIGSAPNSFFMHRAAEIGRGTFTHIGSTAQVASRMGEFFTKLENPVMTGLSATVEGGAIAEVTPDPLPDLYLGEPVVLTARMDGPDGKLQISGDFAGQPWQVDMDLAAAARGEGIAKLWARRKIDSLEASRSFGADLGSVDRQIEETALEHHLVSRLTSLVAVDVTKSRPDDEKLTSSKLPLNLPQEWEYDKVYRDQSADSQAAFLQKVPTRGLRLSLTTRLAALAPSPEAEAAPADAAAAQRLAQAKPAVVTTQRKPVILPQTATSAEMAIAIGLALIAIAALILFADRRASRRRRRRFTIE